MKIAICNETYRDWSFEDAFRHASDCGYDGIEIAPFTIQQDLTSVPAERIEEICQLADQHQLQIVGLHWLLAFTSGFHLTHPSASIRKRTAGYLGQLAALCSELNGRIMVFGSPQQRNLQAGTSRQEGNDLACDCLRQLVPALEEHQITLAMEPLGPEEGNFLTTAQWGRELVEQLDHELVQLHLDVKAMSTESDAVDSIIHQSANQLVHFHANDPNRRGPGMGDVCFKPILGALNEINYSDWISVEVFDETVPPETTATQSIEYLRKTLAEI